MKKFLLYLCGVLLLAPQLVFAQFAGADYYLVGRVVSADTITDETGTLSQKLITVTKDGQQVSLTQELTSDFAPEYKIDDKLIIGAIEQAGEEQPFYYVQDRYRFPSLMWTLAIFLLVVIGLGRMQGVRSILALLLSIVIITKVMIPLFLKGWNPLFVSITGALFISICALYLSHGVRRRTHIAFASTTITFILAAIFAIITVNAAELFGLGTEEAMFLLGDAANPLNLKGLLLGGIIIGTLGVLDDITTSQAAAVDELYKANNSLSFWDLYHRAASIGTDHIASLVNTLALAYAGAALPLFLLFSINQADPFWVILNSEFIAEEFVRTLVGSVALILAVPITTLLATYITQKYGASHDSCGHQHYH